MIPVFRFNNAIGLFNYDQICLFNLMHHTLIHVCLFPIYYISSYIQWLEHCIYTSYTQQYQPMVFESAFE